MKTYRDSDQAELNHLLAVCNLAGKLVLEIGCADGKFTRQYANMPARVIAINP